MSIRENKKFRKEADEGSSNTPHSLKDFVSDIKSTFSVKYAHSLLRPSTFDILIDIKCISKIQSTKRKRIIASSYEIVFFLSDMYMYGMH